MDWIHLAQDMNWDTVMKNTISWFVIPCNSERCRRFGEILSPSSDLKIIQARNQQKQASVVSSLVYSSTPEDGDGMFLGNDVLSPNYMMLQPGRPMVFREPQMQRSNEPSDGMLGILCVVELLLRFSRTLLCGASLLVRCEISFYNIICFQTSRTNQRTRCGSANFTKMGVGNFREIGLKVLGSVLPPQHFPLQNC
jgi:hypothetical protein